jgi:large subunit ribosomal protein L29
MVMEVKSNKFLDDLKKKTIKELGDELVSAKKELFNLRFQNATNQLNNTSRISDVRKNIARINTIITKKAMGLLE